MLAQLCSTALEKRAISRRQSVKNFKRMVQFIRQLLAASEEIRKPHFPSISYYFYIPKNFDYLEFHCPTEEKIGIDEKVICYHNISNLLWEKDVLCAWKRK